MTLKVFWLGMVAAMSLNTAPAADIDAVIDRAMQKQSIPGVSAVVVRDGQVIYSSGRGVADIESGRAMDDETVMYIGSLSKILTAVLALQQVESGRLAMTDTLDRQPTITVRHLLTHQSGLPREGGFDYWFSGEFPDAPTLAAYVDRAPLEFEPGSRTRYSNIGYAALGALLADRAEQDFETLLRARVLEPLGMEDSGARGPAPGVATAYSPAGRLIPDSERPFAGVGDAIDGRHVRVYHDAGAMSPAFGAYSTARDMGRLLMFLLGNGREGVLSREMRVRMYEPVASNRGLGLRMESLDGRRVARHGGWFAGYRSHLLLDPARGIGIVVLANSDSASPDAIVDELFRTAAQSYTEAPQVPWSALVRSCTGESWRATRTSG
ncbi:MAG: serine hydrolase domain-containing protein [Xanthomonadales bacterium]|nr:serine hydrolase domain-containing protein [Xanthomonadales bacterium]